jgi:hypothetical protein
VSCTGSICCFWFRGNAITGACGLALGVSGVPEPEAGPSCCSGRSTKAPKHTRRHRRLDPGVTGARVLIIRRTLALGLYGTPWVRSSQTRRSPLFPYGRVSTGNRDETKARITCIGHASTCGAKSGRFRCRTREYLRQPGDHLLKCLPEFTCHAPAASFLKHSPPTHLPR